MSFLNYLLKLFCESLRLLCLIKKQKEEAKFRKINNFFATLKIHANGRNIHTIKNCKKESKSCVDKGPCDIVSATQLS